jgi:hypothetical protein
VTVVVAPIAPVGSGFPGCYFEVPVFEHTAGFVPLGFGIGYHFEALGIVVEPVLPDFGLFGKVSLSEHIEPHPMD